MEKRIIEKMCKHILNLRHLGFNGSAWPDIQAATGELSPAEKAALTRALEEAGGVFRGKTWAFDQLDVNALRAMPVASPIVPVKLVTILSKVPAGTWGRDIQGKIKFIKDPDFHFPNIEADVDQDNIQDEDSDTDEGSYTEEPTKGKLDIDL